MPRYWPAAVRLSGGKPFVSRTAASMPSPRMSKATVGSAIGPVAWPLPVTVPRRPRLPATRSTSASGKAWRFIATSRSPGPSGTEPLAEAARPFCELTEASRFSRLSAVCPVALTATGGSPAPRVIAEPMPSPATSKRTSGVARGPVTRAVPFTVPASPSAGWMALAIASGRSRMAMSTSKLSSILPCAIRLPWPKSRSSGVSSTALPRIVTVDGCGQGRGDAASGAGGASRGLRRSRRRGARARPTGRRGCRPPAGRRPRTSSASGRPGRRWH